MAAAIGELSRSHVAPRQEVGGLSQSYGFTLEDIARTVLPSWLERHLQVQASHSNENLPRRAPAKRKSICSRPAERTGRQFR